MNCNRCGFLLINNSKFCENCGNKIEINNKTKKKFFQNKKTLFIIASCLIIILLITIIIIYINSKNIRSEILTNIEHNDYLKFTIDEQEFYVGNKVQDFQKKNYSYDKQYITADDYIIKDSIMMQTFYLNEEPKFLGAMYCNDDNNCKYNETTIVKINFYSDSNVIVNDFIKHGLSYDEIVEKYGKEDGKFYQNEDMLVWTFGEKGKIGEPYYILRFDTGGWFSSDKLIDIRIGVWWYDGEYEHTVIKNSVGGGESNEKQ